MLRAADRMYESLVEPACWALCRLSCVQSQPRRDACHVERRAVRLSWPAPRRSGPCARPALTCSRSSSVSAATVGRGRCYWGGGRRAGAKAMQTRCVCVPHGRLYGGGRRVQYARVGWVGGCAGCAGTWDAVRRLPLWRRPYGGWPAVAVACLWRRDPPARSLQGDGGALALAPCGTSTSCAFETSKRVHVHVWRVASWSTVVVSCVVVKKLK